jgi:hypothetical protein
MLGLFTLSVGCGSESSDRISQAGLGSRDDGPWFTDVATEVGLDFVHVNGASGRLYMPEILGAGAALFDYDADGDLDVFILQGRPLGPAQSDQPTPAVGPSRLFRNDLHIRPDGSRTMAFTDVTGPSGLDVHGYAMGVASGDVDNDGCVDLFVTGFGLNQLFQNGCAGVFREVWRHAGSDWSVPAAFVDYDRDGWLDLYVGNYVHYALDAKTQCRAPSGEPDYCTPQAFRPQPDRLYRNQGHGRLVEVSATALAGGPFGPALGVSTADFNGDGWIDIYVANDGAPNLLWLNQRNGAFRNVALLAGAALSADGRPEGSMGVDAGDFDNDGDEDLFMTELPHEGNNLFVNDGTATFEDRSARGGVGPSSIGFTGFGTGWIDFDNDGWLDLLNVNGAVSLKPSRSNRPFPYDEKSALFRNLRDGRFEDATAAAGEVFGVSDVGRGAAFGDIDNDGDTDVLVTNNNGPVRLLLNQIGNRQRWVGVRLVDRGLRRDMLGARVAITLPDGRTLWRRARSDGSYASANDPRVLVGLGASSDPVRVRVLWPDGRAEEWTDLPVDRWTTLEKGSGR